MGDSTRRKKSARVSFSPSVPEEARAGLAQVIGRYFPRAAKMKAWDLRRRLKGSLRRRGMKFLGMRREPGALYLCVKAAGRVLGLRITEES